MRSSLQLLRPALLATLLTLGASLVACGDDGETTNQGSGGGGAGTSSDASSSASGSSTSGSASSNTTSSGASTTSGSTESGSESGPVGSGGAGAGEGSGGNGSGGDGGSEPVCPEQPAPYEFGDEPEDACAVFEADEDAPPFHVEFINEPKEVFEYDGTIGVDFAFQYLLALPIEDLADFTLTESRCQRLAGDDEETCSEGEVDISEVETSCSVRYGGRFGLDPENVNVGTNEFDFTMTLRTGCAEVATTFTFVVDYQPQN